MAVQGLAELVVVAVEEVGRKLCHGFLACHQHVHLSGHDEQPAQLIESGGNLRAGVFLIPGLDAVGNDADLVIFDYDKLNDTPTYSNPVQMCDGIEYVIVGGKIVYHDKKTTGEYPGKIL